MDGRYVCRADGAGGARIEDLAFAMNTQHSSKYQAHRAMTSLPDINVKSTHTNIYNMCHKYTPAAISFAMAVKSSS